MNNTKEQNYNNEIQDKMKQNEQAGASPSTKTKQSSNGNNRYRYGNYETDGEEERAFELTMMLIACEEDRNRIEKREEELHDRWFGDNEDNYYDQSNDWFDYSYYEDD